MLHGNESRRHYFTTTQQKPDNKPRIEATTTEKLALIQQQAPKPAAQKPKIQNQQGPGECEKCQVRPACKTVLKLWHQHAPRPELARAWCRLIDEHAKDMVCLSGIREGNR